jgi:hypothetical protein
MTRYNRLYQLFLMTLLILTLAACNSAAQQQVTLDDIPIYEGARTLKRGDNLLVDTLATTVEQMAEQEYDSTEVKRYEAPTGAQQNELYHFYAQELAATGWQKTGRIEHDNPPVVIEVWTKGEGEDQQALFIGMANDPVAGNSAFFVTALSADQIL